MLLQVKHKQWFNASQIFAFDRWTPLNHYVVENRWLEVNDWIWFCCSANDKNQCTRPAIFSSEQCTNLKGECIVMWKNQRTSALIFAICTSTKSYQSLTSFIHVIIFMQICLWWKPPIDMPKFAKKYPKGTCRGNVRLVYIYHNVRNPRLVWHHHGMYTNHPLTLKSFNLTLISFM